jgi:hypothetical protein
MNPFMRAHGSLPGPTQRPVVAGVLSGLVALVPAISLAWTSGALAAIASGVGLHGGVVAAAFAAAAAGAGALYGRTFMRAANDRRGGWLFGIGFGFALWMAGTGAVAFLFSRAPLVTGRPAQALLGSHLLYGLTLGAVFPLVHGFVQRRSPWARSSTTR